MTRSRWLAAAALAVLLSACSTYDGRYSYSPAPASARVHALADGPADARVLVSVKGVRHADDEAQLPAGVEVRFRVENLGDHAVTIDPSRLKLVTADLAELPLAAVEPAGEMVAGPRETSHWQLFYGFPSGGDSADFDLQGLDFSWTLNVRGRAVSGGHEFARDEAHWAYYGGPYYSDPYCPWYYPRFHFGYHHY